jgi:hypothetical protein
MIYSVRPGLWQRVIAVVLLVLAGNLLAASRSQAADKSDDPPAAPITQGLRVFTCGHSFHVFVYPLLNEMAQAAGIKDHQSVGISRIGGSRVIQHWNVADEKNEAKAALRAGKVDVLTLSPIWLPEEGIEKFASLAVEHNPNVRVTVQEYWLPNDTYEPKYPLDTRKKVDHNATNLAELKKSNDAYCHDIEEYVRSLNEQLGKNAIFVVPVGEASVALREKILAGEAPGLKAQWDLFSDTWGHAKPALQVLSGYCHFAVIYRRSPVGLPVPSLLAKDKSLSDADKEKLNRLLQEIAWETVRHHPLTGLTAEAAPVGQGAP